MCSGLVLPLEIRRGAVRSAWGDHQHVGSWIQEVLQHFERESSRVLWSYLCFVYELNSTTCSGLVREHNGVLFVSIELREEKLSGGLGSVSVKLYPGVRDCVGEYMLMSMPVTLRLSPSTSQLLWVFSECLEPLAIVPQLIVLQRYREVENLTGE